MNISSTVPGWKPGPNPPDKTQIALLNEIVNRTAVHEQKHRDIAAASAQAAVCAGYGKSRGEDKKAVDQAMCDMERANIALDMAEGNISIVKKLDGKYSVVQSGAPSRPLPNYCHN
jgi:hypothetical protein